MCALQIISGGADERARLLRRSASATGISYLECVDREELRARRECITCRVSSNSHGAYQGSRLYVHRRLVAPLGKPSQTSCSTGLSSQRLRSLPFSRPSPSSKRLQSLPSRPRSPLSKRHRSL